MIRLKLNGVRVSVTIGWAAALTAGKASTAIAAMNARMSRAALGNHRTPVPCPGSNLGRDARMVLLLL